MKWLTYLILFFLPFDSIFCQSKYIKDPALSINFTLTDFKTAANIKTDGIGQIFYFEKMEPKGGVSLQYIQGMSNHFDYKITINGCFVDYPLPGMAAFEKNNLLLDLTGSFNYKLNTDKNLLSPYLTAGAGISKYKSFFGINLPTGIGLQLNYKNDIYILIQSVYSFGITNKVNDYVRHSIGIAGNIKRKQKINQPLPSIAATSSPIINPDRDRDGIIDVQDSCPDIAGLLSLHGCPDLDGDGIADTDDKCPAVYGISKYQGCPIPDTDNDGSNDEVDKCINKPGPLSNNGCPVIDSISKLKINEAARNIFFETGSAKLLSKSFDPLNQVCKILEEHKSYLISIEGHTDSIGDSIYNQDLSEKRANIVLMYLESKGISVHRIIAKGFGEDVSVADNKTAMGRSKNRRVEIILKLKFE